MCDCERYSPVCSCNSKQKRAVCSNLKASLEPGTMTRTAAWLCGLLLGFVWVVPTVVMSTPAELCKSMNTLKASLNLINRRQYMKHNFPINYTIRVHYEEVFRVHNISRLRARVQGLEARELQNLWLLVNQQVLKRILRVLPERHPSHKYTSDLENLFRMVQQVFQQVFQQQQLGPQGEEREPPERIQEILDRMSDPDVKVWKWKSVRPKALLDNCYRTMHCLFQDCFQSNEDFCSILHWRKGNKRLPKQA
ncbi:hypothetical protein AAFF_G00421360 [Aldrovandia affinis]|uniref:Interleukin 34 n=1 Tax=Aldrovandia affinis TaxID=143900 RepID=A0AAD7WJ09_9TELE|nr:hypothetical protein AAFF_G00421360 [Aldrovandia affinis]